MGAVGCSLTFAIGATADIALQVAVARRPGQAIEDHLDVVNNGLRVPIREIVEPGLDRQHVVRVEPGQVVVSYQGVLVRPEPSGPPPVTDAQRVIALRPSRYCPSDRMVGFARSHFGELASPRDQVQAICDYVWRHVGYAPATSGPQSDAIETLSLGRGVCRDFAHLVVALCRAVDVPARMAAVYAPGLSPMDFHAVAETAIDGAWWAWDATRLAPRQSLIRIATGRDAADIAFATTLSGLVELSGMEVRAIAAGALSFDDHVGYVALA